LKPLAQEKKILLTVVRKEDKKKKRKRAILLPINPRNIMSTENTVSLPFGACMIHFLVFTFLDHGWTREVGDKNNLSILMENVQETSKYIEVINAAQKRLEAEVERTSGLNAPNIFFGTPPGETSEKVFSDYSSGSGSIRLSWKESFVLISFHLGRKGEESPRIGEGKIYYNNPKKVVFSWKNEHLFRGTVGDEKMGYILDLTSNFLKLFGQKMPPVPDRTPVPQLNQMSRTSRGREQMMRF
jgi:hypothetical protein